MAMHRSKNNKNDEEEEEEEEADNHDVLTGCTPAHLLCMQNPPSMSLVRFFSLRDPKAFLLCDQQGRCALHLVAIFSESLELLQSMLQIDHTMINRAIANVEIGTATALGLLCKRLEFPKLKRMVTSLVEVGCSIGIIYDGIIGSIRQSEESSFSDITLGSGGERIFDLIKALLNANPEAANYRDSSIFHQACCHLRGQLGIAVVMFFLTKNGDGIRSYCTRERLPIHCAAKHSTTDMLTFLHGAYPESSSILVPNKGWNLLHLTIIDQLTGDKISKLQYLCHQCPQLIHMKDNAGRTVLHCAFYPYQDKLNLEAVKILCNADETVVRDRCSYFDSLPLHILIRYRSPILEVSNEANCFRLFLLLYPASAGIKNGRSKSPYDLAVTKNLNQYFIRLLLANDPTIDPVKMKDLNFKARREGMFLAFRALSTIVKPIIWSKLRYENVELLTRVICYL